MIQRLAFAILFLGTVILHPSMSAYVTVGYSPEKTDFSVSFRDETSFQKITSIFALPGEPIALQMSSDDKNALYAVSDLANVKSRAVGAANGQLVHGYPATLSWKAPEKVGTYLASVQNMSTGKSMDLRVFVMVPFSQTKSGAINGFKIGQYPHIPSSKMAHYSLPRGFVEVTKENKDLLLTPHFKLGQFLCKQTNVFPQYVVLRERLLFKLEYVLEFVNKEGIPAKTFSVMSGYRTPFYNRELGNVKYSRHMWGDAADIYINDDPHAIGMGDLNGDGKCDIKDAEMLYGVVNQLSNEPSFVQFIGGLGRYKPTSSHGPFVHLDARGERANWSGS